MDFLSKTLNLFSGIGKNLFSLTNEYAFPISEILNTGIGLMSSSNSQNALDHMSAEYRNMAIVNAQIGKFNADVYERLGQETSDAIAKNVARALGTQRAEFARSGFSLEGSPMIVMAETVNEGSKRAQDAVFNAEVKRINTLFEANTAISTMNNKVDDIGYQIKMNRYNMTKGLLKDIPNIFNSIKRVTNKQPVPTVSVSDSYLPIAKALGGA